MEPQNKDPYFFMDLPPSIDSRGPDKKAAGGLK